MKVNVSIDINESELIGDITELYFGQMADSNTKTRIKRYVWDCINQEIYDGTIGEYIEVKVDYEIM